MKKHHLISMDSLSTADSSSSKPCDSPRDILTRFSKALESASSKILHFTGNQPKANSTFSSSQNSQKWSQLLFSLYEELAELPFPTYTAYAYVLFKRCTLPLCKPTVSFQRILEVFIGCLSISSKLLDDNFNLSEVLSEVSKVPLPSLAALETTIIFKFTKGKVHVSEQEFQFEFDSVQDLFE